jgi:twitching motility protein PilT
MAVKQTPELDRALQLAVDQSASDLYLIPGEPVALRIGSKVERTQGEPLTAADVRRIAVAAFGEDRLAKLGTETGRIDTSCELPGVASGRMCVASARGEPTIVVRILPSRLWDVKEMGVPQSVLKAAESPNGLLIFSGSTGSGKTTTMFSVLDWWNASHDGHICTVEDPIGVVLTPKRSIVQQREVGIDVPDVLAGVAAAMRQDLDVLMVGELKSNDELEACLAAVETGHLLFVQVHAESPTMAIQRLLEVQPREELQQPRLQLFCQRLARVLRCVVCQMLLPHASGKGRVAAYSVLVPDNAIRNQISHCQNLVPRNEPWPEGSLTFRDGIEILRREGKITEEVARQAIASLPESM